MILPSIDLQRGHAVQLRGGAEFVLDGGPPLPWLERFARVGEVAVVDLDAALGRGDNQAVVRDLCQRAPCRVGGGIKTAAQALDLLDAGATKVVLGTRAVPEVLRELPPERVVAALDAVHGEVVVDGWRTRTGRSVEERMRELRPYVGGFLVTFVEREGRLTGLDLPAVQALRAAADGAELVVAGGVATPQDIKALDDLGVHAQVGMALYTGVFTVADALVALLPPEPPGGLWPTVVVDEHERALGLCWSSRESLAAALAEGRGIYQSRRRGLWRKGETSGAVQELLRVDLDCDRDALRFVVRQHGPGFCHCGTATCWGSFHGLPALQQRIAKSAADPAAGGYTPKLLREPSWLAAKLPEEAAELAAASDPTAAAAEAADLLYFASVALQRHGVPFAAVERELDRRARQVRRRQGPPKAAPEAAP